MAKELQVCTTLSMYIGIYIEQPFVGRSK